MVVRRVLFAAVALSMTLAACSSAPEQTAAGSDSTTPETSATDTETTSPPTTTTGSDVTLTGVPVGVGDCVTLSGGASTAAATEATCGSAEANYRVSQTVRQSGECPADTDQVYYETVDGVEQGALCLDIDWVVDGCMAVPFDEPARRVDCADPEATFVSRATRILEGTDSVDACGAGGGFAYSVRKFVVCAEEVLAPAPPVPTTPAPTTPAPAPGG